MNIRIDTGSTEPFSPYVFGHNLEHTRAAVGRGLSAQMLRNRKFAGKPARNSGVAADWIGIGAGAFFQNGGRACYTRHIGCEAMRRLNELQSQSVQNVRGELCGLAQGGLAVSAGKAYEIRAVTLCSAPLTLTVMLTSRLGDQVYASRDIDLLPGDWQTSVFSLTSSADDDEAVIRFLFTERAEVVFGALSMLPEGHFHGMRADVVSRLKEIGPTIIRWPGGNFAGEYRWKDGLLPSDQRGPLQAAMEIETQPYSHGYDFHEISTDDFIALCREIGAEPFLTINLVWNSPQDSADWVEYCNGAADTEYGRMRAENGHPEPYNVRFWSLGNEMGYGHMEGPMSPEDYASLASSHAEAMRAVSPDIALFSSGPYPNDLWAEKSAARLASSVKYISLHHYANSPMDYTSPEKTAETYRGIVGAPEGALQLAQTMRACLDKTGETLRISFDEWNYWYAWYRPSCVAEGVFTAKMLHMLMRSSNALDMPVCCYFQPVGEGAIIVGERSASLTANGQVFSLMRRHCGGRLCAVEGADDGSVAATTKDGMLTVTLINDSYDSERRLTVDGFGAAGNGVLYASEDVAPHSRFTASPLEIRRDGGAVTVVLPPHSVALLTNAL